MKIWSWSTTSLLCAAMFLAPPVIAQEAKIVTMPALRVVSPNGIVNTVIGSMHIGMPGMLIPQPAVLDGSKMYVVESQRDNGPIKHPRGEAPEVTGRRQAGLEPGAADWTTSLSKPQMATLVDRSRCGKADLQRALTRVSPLDALSIAYFRCAYQDLPSRDGSLLTAARERHVPQVVLEYQWEVEDRRLKVPPEAYLGLLKYALSPQSDVTYQRASDALNAGDYGLVGELSAASIDPRFRSLYNHVMVEDRNRTWMRTLMPYLDDGPTVVNVGAAHLSGRTGLIELLRSKGYKVEVVRVPAYVAPEHVISQ